VLLLRGLRHKTGLSRLRPAMSTPSLPPAPPAASVPVVFRTLTIAFAAALGVALLLLAVLGCRLTRDWLRQRQLRRKYDVFLSYRVKADLPLVEKLYELLVARELSVWWDKKNLLMGLPWEQGFVDGLRSSLVVVPVLSRKALAPFCELKPESRCDNVLLEHALALEFRERAMVRRTPHAAAPLSPPHPNGGRRSRWPPRAARLLRRTG